MSKFVPYWQPFLEPYRHTPLYMCWNYAILRLCVEIFVVWDFPGKSQLRVWVPLRFCISVSSELILGYPLLTLNLNNFRFWGSTDKPNSALESQRNSKNVEQGWFSQKNLAQNLHRALKCFLIFQASLFSFFVRCFCDLQTVSDSTVYSFLQCFTFGSYQYELI